LIWLLARPQARQYHPKAKPHQCPVSTQEISLVRDHHWAHGAAGTNMTRVPRILSSQETSDLDNSGCSYEHVRKETADLRSSAPVGILSNDNEEGQHGLRETTCCRVNARTVATTERCSSRPWVSEMRTSEMVKPITLYVWNTMGTNAVGLRHVVPSE